MRKVAREKEMSVVGPLKRVKDLNAPFSGDMKLTSIYTHKKSE